MMSVRLPPKTNLVGPWNVVGQLYYIFIFNHFFLIISVLSNFLTPLMYSFY